MSSSIAHLMTFAKETNFDPMDREGPIKHLEAYMNQTTEDAITKNENRYKHLVGFLKNNLNDMPKGMKEKLKDILVMNNFIEVESLDPEPTVKAAKGKGRLSMWSAYQEQEAVQEERTSRVRWKVQTAQGRAGTRQGCFR